MNYGDTILNSLQSAPPTHPPRFWRKGSILEIDTDKIDDAVLALLWLTLHDERRAWKGFDWDALGRLHQKGLIDNPATKTKSVMLSDAGLKRSEALFHALFARS